MNKLAPKKEKYDKILLLYSSGLNTSYMLNSF